MHQVDLPGGGRLELNGPDEVSLWNESARRYVEDYGIIKQNDLVQVGAILAQQIAMYRAQKDMVDPKRAAQATKQIAETTAAIQATEKVLGIDKKTREAGGKHTTADYIGTLKKAAHAMGVRISERVRDYESFAMEMRWRIRVLRNADAEDRAYHGITPESVLKFAEDTLAELEQKDKKWAKDNGAIFVGKL